jgi:hypothetical protein
VTVYAEMFVTVRPDPPAGARPWILGLATTQDPGDISATVDPQDDLIQALAPANRIQTIHTEATVQGPAGPVSLTADDIVEWSYAEDADGITWDLSVAAQEVTRFGRWTTGPLLTEQAYGGAPPPGVGGVRLSAGIETWRGAVTDFTVVGGGLTTKATRPVLGAERVLRLTGVGYWGRYDRRLVSLSLPPGHGKTHGELFNLILTELGFSQAQLPGDFGEPLQNPVELHCEPGWPEAVRVADGAGLRPRFTQDATPRVEMVPLVPSRSAQPVRTFTAFDFLAGETSDAEADGDVPTHYIVRGLRAELPGGAEGAVSTVTRVETWDDAFVIPQARFLQRPSGGFDPGGFIPLDVDEEPRRALVSAVTTTVTTVGGCEIVREVVTEGWGAPIAARYRQNVPLGASEAGPHEYLETFIYDPDAEKDDEAEAYELPAFVFRVETRVREELSWGKVQTVQGLTFAQVRAILRDSGNGTFTAKRPGDLMVRTIKAAAWFNPRRALGQEGQATDAVLLTAGGVGVLYVAEGYFDGPSDPPFAETDVQILRDRTRKVRHWISADRTVYEGDDEGYLVKTLRVLKTWARDLKEPWLYDDDERSSAEIEVGRETETIETTYTAANRKTHTSIESKWDVTGESAGQVIRFEGVYKPTREYCDPADALSGSNRPVSGEIFCGEGTHVGQVPEEIEHAYIERDEAALRRAEIECIRDHALTLRGSTLPDPRLRALDPVVIDLPDAGLARRRAWIDSYDCSKGARAPGGAPETVVQSFIFRLDPRG